MVEIETEIAPSTSSACGSQRRETLQKARYSWPDGRFHWDVDFFKTDDGQTYFAMAEVEMPEDDTVPPPLPAASPATLLPRAAQRPALHVQAAVRIRRMPRSCWPTSGERGSVA